MNYLLYVTGAASAALTPLNLLTFDAIRPGETMTVVLSRTAETFVTVRACSASGTRTVYRDRWDDELALHLHLAAAADRIIVHPATLNFLGRLSSGITDTPMMLALQCTDAPVYLCPAIPPGAENSAAFGAARSFVAAHPQYHLVDTLPAYSAALRTEAGRAPVSFAEVLELCTGFERAPR
ncbi:MULTISPECIES: flavoprotein [Nocardia]|uniref:Flavoprotein domain-containing protein n=2 Tax=Nocardia TaxID=1817 RepID=A0A2T2YQP6_9NOCA|nr:MULTISPECIES: flavoprotein [Nocardia]MBF6242233.1 hypothetical protein [Nocardia elegans]MBF6446936.1 hypothetical protein [Nocardia elegans]PSR57821.1 hypothetical protein C8259_33065 [Nocardia nova]